MFHKGSEVELLHNIQCVSKNMCPVCGAAVEELKIQPSLFCYACLG